MKSVAIPFLVLGALLCSAMAASSVAAPPASTRAVTVPYADAELEHAAGIARVHSRLASAASQVCRPYDGFELAQRRAYERCAARTLAASVTRIGSAALTAYHHGRHQRTVPDALLAREHARDLR